MDPGFYYLRQMQYAITLKLECLQRPILEESVHFANR